MAGHWGRPRYDDRLVTVRCGPHDQGVESVYTSTGTNEPQNVASEVVARAGTQHVHGPAIQGGVLRTFSDMPIMAGQRVRQLCGTHFMMIVDTIPTPTPT